MRPPIRPTAQAKEEEEDEKKGVTGQEHPA